MENKGKELRDLKPGDKVLLRGHWNESIITVNRVTNTQIIVGRGNMRFRIKDGWPVGGGGGIISIPTEKDYQRIRETLHRRNLEGRFEKIRLCSLSIDKLERILKIVEE